MKRGIAFHCLSQSDVIVRRMILVSLDDEA